ncbi:MAG TPA: hypothetical protein VGB54_02430 [Allosphingosinicella sp.]
MDREGSNAGRGFHFQDAVAGHHAVASWSGQAASALVIPEGGDDVERREEDGPVFVQVKSRREHLGQLPLSDASAFVAKLWERADSVNGSPSFELVVERGVAACEGHDGPGLPAALSQMLRTDSRFPEFASSTTLCTTNAPREAAIRLIENKLGCVPAVAELCVAQIVARVTELADDNGRRTPDAYVGLSPSDVDRIVTDTVAATDPNALERAIREGACEPVDFLTPLADSNFYLGVDVQPGHVAAGLVSERPSDREAIANALRDRPVLVAGPSGAGKSALMWDTAHALRHVIRWYRLRRVDERDVPALTQLMRTMRVGPNSPVGLIVDDVGRRGVEGWSALVREVNPIPGAILLGSIREEDVLLVSERARQTEIRVAPDPGLAERLWKELRAQGHTVSPGWVEPWGQSGGLTLEYVHILTQARRFEEVLADQVAARVRDPDRELELDVLRIAACASSAGAAVDPSRLPAVVSASDGAVSRSLHRLIDEHLVRQNAAGHLTGLHQLRSAELFRLTHTVPPPSAETTLLRTIASATDDGLEPLLADAIGKRDVAVPTILAAAAARIVAQPTTSILSAALRGAGAGQIRLGVADWLAQPTTASLPRTQVGTAAMLGVPELAALDLPMLGDIQRAAAALKAIRTDQGRDLRRQLIAALPGDIVAELVGAARTAVELEALLSALVGGGWTPAIRAALTKRGPVGLDGELTAVSKLLATLAVLDRDLARVWAEQTGFDRLPGRLAREYPWATAASLENTDEGLAIHSDYWHVADAVQADPHEDVVRLCQTTLGLWPAAEIGKSSAIAANGRPVGTSDLDIATKRIPRANLPPTAMTRWNQLWHEAITRSVSAPTYSGYLSEAAAMLDEIAPLLNRVLDLILRGRKAPEAPLAELGNLFKRAQALTPPAQSAFEASGQGSTEPVRTVTKLQSVLFQASADLTRQFAKLPENGGIYLSNLNEAIQSCEEAAVSEPWILLGGAQPSALERLKKTFIALREIAGHAIARGRRPSDLFCESAKKARPGNAIAVCAALASGGSSRRRQDAQATVQRALDAAGLAAEVRLVDDPKGSLPWPPYEVLALVPAENVLNALAGVETLKPVLRAAVDEFARLTLVPMVKGFALPQYSVSGHQSFLPSGDAAVALLDRIGIARLNAPLFDAVSDAFAHAGWLASMDRNDLGKSERAAPEADARSILEGRLASRLKSIAERMAVLDKSDQQGTELLLDYVSSVRSGELNLADAAYDMLHGAQHQQALDLAVPYLAAIETELKFAVAGASAR